MSGIDRDLWLKALNDAGLQHEDDQGAITIEEFATIIGMKRVAASCRLEALVVAGKAVKTRKRTTTTDGRRTFYAVAYRLLGAKAGRKRR